MIHFNLIKPSSKDLSKVKIPEYMNTLVNEGINLNFENIKLGELDIKCPDDELDKKSPSKLRLYAIQSLVRGKISKD